MAKMFWRRHMVSPPQRVIGDVDKLSTLCHLPMPSLHPDMDWLLGQTLNILAVNAKRSMRYLFRLYQLFLLSLRTRRLMQPQRATSSRCRGAIKRSRMFGLRSSSGRSSRAFVPRIVELFISWLQQICTQMDNKCLVDRRRYAYCFVTNIIRYLLLSNYWLHYVASKLSRCAFPNAHCGCNHNLVLVSGT